MKLKDGQTRDFIHRYDLRIETKNTDSEVDCEKLILKQLQLFHSLILQADPTALIPPYLSLDRNNQGFKDLSARATVVSLRGTGITKMYVHRLLPRPEGGQFYCNIILATSISPPSLQDALAIHLRDNRMGLWQQAIDAEQVTEIGWLLYSSRQQDEKRISGLLSKLTGEKIGARWRLVKTNKTTRRKPNDTQGNKAPDVQALHLECHSTTAQYTKHKIARLYSSTTTNFP